MSVFQSPQWLQSILTWAVISTLTIWTVATSTRVFDPVRERLKAVIGEPGLSLIPSYRFFAPEPARYDFHLLYRTKTEDERVTDWQHCDEFIDFPSQLHWAWNPQLYDTKAMFDYAQSLYEAVKDEKEKDNDAEVTDDVSTSSLQQIDMEDYVVSTPYIALLNYVSHLPGVSDSKEVQYLIIRGSLREEESKPFFLSYFHEV
ncbi:hypothetical protein NKF06_08175 [Haloferax sp. AB510]|uniref:hypothetical protein n=1 Tax=Haloferax sp. AB510 TaxID=2934172 RepID=UPI00209BECCE|nr:hypothetical protein [Haloferax sp. AB510]MCO8266560.1 hypothetical protein [Haloferax sp. AB510]